MFCVCETRVQNLQGNAKKAIRDLDIALRIDPDYSEAFEVRAQAHESLGSVAAAHADRLSAEALQSGS